MMYDYKEFDSLLHEYKASAMSAKLIEMHTVFRLQRLFRK